MLILLALYRGGYTRRQETIKGHTFILILLFLISIRRVSIVLKIGKINFSNIDNHNTNKFIHKNNILFENLEKQILMAEDSYQNANGLE